MKKKELKRIIKAQGKNIDTLFEAYNSLMVHLHRAGVLEQPKPQDYTKQEGCFERVGPTVVMAGDYFQPAKNDEDEDDCYVCHLESELGALKEAYEDFQNMLPRQEIAEVIYHGLETGLAMDTRIEIELEKYLAWIKESHPYSEYLAAKNSGAN